MLRCCVCLQGFEPYVYSEFQCIDLMMSAAKANDVPFIDTIWQRLCRDLQRNRLDNDKTQARIKSDSEIVKAISRGGAAPSEDDTAAAAAASDSSSKKRKQQRAKANTHASAVKAYVMCEAYGKAFEMLHTMEQLYPGDEFCSVYSGVRFFPESLDTETKLGAAFEQLQLRKVGLSVCTWYML